MEHNAVLVDVLESLGAVPFVKTNVPQTLMVSLLVLQVNDFSLEIIVGGNF